MTRPDAFHFVDGADVENEYAYDANGNTVKDLNKNITSITYNSLNLPIVTTYGNGNTATYVYDGAGNKLSVAYKTGGKTAKTEYAGNKVYNNGTLSIILTEEGYVTGTTPTYYYYLKDHQGNNRVVINQGGAVQQVNHYYAFGGLFGEGLQTSGQPYKYNGKELDTKIGLNMYDYGARHYDAALGRWFTVDPLAEKYYGISPYVYCMNNPMKYIDPFGMDTYLIIYGSGWANPQMQGQQYDVGDGFRKNAEVMKSQIEKSSFFTENDKVEIVYAATEKDYINALNKEYESGKIAGLNVYSHGTNNSVNLGGPLDGPVETSKADADYRMVSAFSSEQNPGGGNEISQIIVNNFTENANVTFWGCNIGGSSQANSSSSHAQTMATHLGGNRTVNAFVGGGGAEFKTLHDKLVFDGTMIRSADRIIQQTKLTLFRPQP